MAYVARDIHNLSSHGRRHHPQPAHDHAAGYAGSFIGSIAGSQSNVSRASGISKNAMPIPAAHEDEGRKSKQKKKKKKKKKKSKAPGEVSSSSCSSTEEEESGLENLEASDLSLIHI